MIQKSLQNIISSDFDPENLKKSSGSNFSFAKNDTELRRVLPEDSENLLVITGMDVVKEMFDSLGIYEEANVIKTENPSYHRVNIISKWVNDNSIDKIMGFGGGTVIDVSKRVSFESRIGESIKEGEVNPRYIAVPTVGSHDGPFSSGSSLYDHGIDTDKQEINVFRKSELANAASEVVIPVHYWEKAPKDLRLGGIMDVLGNITALQDVSLAKSRNKFDDRDFREYESSSAYSVLLMREYLQSKDFEKLANSIMFSGLAMRTELGSVFASGFEHELERFIRDICEIEERHGKVVGFSSLISAKLYQKNAERFSDLDLYFDPSELYPRFLKLIKEVVDGDEDFFSDLFFELKRTDHELTSLRNLRPRYTLRRELDLNEINLNKILEEIQSDLET